MGTRKPFVSRLSLPLTLLLVASLACALPGQATKTTPAAGQPSSPSTAATTLPVTPGAVQTVDLSTATPTTPPAPPADAMDVLQQNTQSARWTEGQGLLMLMQYAAGEKTAADVFGGQPVTLIEVTGLLSKTQVFLAKNPNAPEALELQRLMGKLSPSSDAIMKYAAPEGSASLPEAHALVDFKHSAPSKDDACNKLWADGFPAPAPGQPPLICVLYKTFQVLGKTYRIFYPKGFTGSAANLTNLTWSQDAMTQSAQTYHSLDGKTLPNTDLIYGVLPDGTSLAEARVVNGACQAHVYPVIALSSEAEFKQTLAHEIFHCYQVLFLPEPTEPNFDQQKWWVEGSADFFSNVVYPTYNVEWTLSNRFDADSVKDGLFDMSYQNTFFFQFMATKLGNLGVLKVLEGLPASGSVSDYAAALNKAIPNFPKFFDDYARAYLDGTIQDTGGGNIPFSPLPGDQVSFAGDGTQPLVTKPFVITRYQLVYSKGIFTQSEATSGTGTDEARPGGGPGAWDKLPGEVKANCGDLKLLFLMTSVTPASAYQTTITYTHQDLPPGTECDACLVGNWRMESDSYNNYLAAVLKPPSVQGLAVADLTASFDAGGVLTANYNNVTESFTVHQTDANGKDLATQMELLFTGAITSQYTTKSGIINIANSNTQIQVSFKMNGQDMGSNGIDPSTMGSYFGFAPTDQYTCTGSTLSVTPLLTGMTVPPLLFNRIPHP